MGVGRSALAHLSRSRAGLAKPTIKKYINRESGRTGKARQTHTTVFKGTLRIIFYLKKASRKEKKTKSERFMSRKFTLDFFLVVSL